MLCTSAKVHPYQKSAFPQQSSALIVASTSAILKAENCLPGFTNTACYCYDTCTRLSIKLKNLSIIDVLCVDFLSTNSCDTKGCPELYMDEHLKD